jgi:hypothetical protein
VDTTQGRRAAVLVAPTLVLLAFVILYPLLKAVVMSFQKDSGLDKTTGMFVEGGNAGFANYQHWLLQQCASSAGGTEPCPPGTLGSQFYDALWVTVFFIGLPASPVPVGWTGALSMPGTLETLGYEPKNVVISAACSSDRELPPGELAFQARRATSAAAWTRGITITYRADGRTYQRQVLGSYAICGETDFPPPEVAHCANPSSTGPAGTPTGTG